MKQNNRMKTNETIKRKRISKIRKEWVRGKRPNVKLKKKKGLFLLNVLQSNVKFIP